MTPLPPRSNRTDTLLPYTTLCRSPFEEVMSSSLVTVTPDARVDECCKKMEDNQVRRLPVVDDQGKCCGIVSQADIALHADKAETGNLVREVSEDRKSTRLNSSH